MKLKQVAEKVCLDFITEAEAENCEVTGGYASDLLSDVMANSKKGDLWITLQVHHNIIAVATLRELAGIVIIGGKKPAEDTIEKAREEGVPLLICDSPGYEVCGRLYELGIHG